MNTLFDPDAYGEGATKRRPRTTSAGDDGKVEPFAPPYVLLANRGGVIGFHVPKHIDRYSTAHALCGIQGHVVEPPEQMVRCVDCEMRRTSES